MSLSVVSVWSGAEMTDAGTNPNSVRHVFSQPIYEYEYSYDGNVQYVLLVLVRVLVSQLGRVRILSLYI
eukprot:scaffold378287_cov15-Prasinocladus_malaysianus.AAC.1